MLEKTWMRFDQKLLLISMKKKYARKLAVAAITFLEQKKISV